MSDEIKEEVSLRDGDHLVRDLDKETEALAGTEVQPLGDASAEVLGSGGRIDLESLVWKKK